VRAAVRLAAEHVPVAICSGAARSEIEATLAAAGIGDAISAIVAAEDVPRGKPAPDGYLAAHRLLAPAMPAADVLVFEDTEVGVISALAAGLRCIAVLGTMGADRLAAAERIVPELDSGVVREALGLSRP
jgi:beta-phosphoglucomutase